MDTNVIPIASFTCATCKHPERVKPITADGDFLNLFCLIKSAYVHRTTHCAEWKGSN